MSDKRPPALLRWSVRQREAPSVGLTQERADCQTDTPGLTLSDSLLSCLVKGQHTRPQVPVSDTHDKAGQGCQTNTSCLIRCLTVSPVLSYVRPTQQASCVSDTYDRTGQGVQTNTPGLTLFDSFLRPVLCQTKTPGLRCLCLTRTTRQDKAVRPDKTGKRRKGKGSCRRPFRRRGKGGF